ncbi:MAG: leucine-rich repeat domain-containing protein [Firmicutes bacterium]|nr:leucine-rich repeat domain-containing protein [Bacillota bacterium]
MEKTKVKYKKVILIAILLLGAVIINVAMLNHNSVYNASVFESEGIILENSMDAELNYLSSVADIMPLGDNNFRENRILPYPNVIFNGMTYIPNRDFFIRNPHHMPNTTDRESPYFLHSFGVCTSVAAQLLISYHNYFTDRRIVPQTHNGRRFLEQNYGNLNYWPSFHLRPTTLRFHQRLLRYRHVSQAQCQQISTTNAMFLDKFDRIPLDWFKPGVLFAQTPSFVATSMNRFIREHYRDANNNRLYNNVEIVSRRANHKTIAARARYEIDNGRPIAIGLDGSKYSDSLISIHGVVAFGHGYQYIDGVRAHGFVVHFGWETYNHNVWVPSTSFDYYIRMQVNNITHNFIVCTNPNNETVIHNGLNYQILRCTNTGVRRPQSPLIFEPIAGTNNVSISARLGAALPADFVIPSTVNIGGTNRTVTAIAVRAFQLNTSILSVSIPETVTSIGEMAFWLTPNLTQVTFAPNSQLQTIGRF